MSIENNTSSESLHTVIERQYRDFERDTFQSLVKAVSTLEDDSFLDAYPYIDLSTEEVEDWCIALDSLLGYLLKHPVELDSDEDRAIDPLWIDLQQLQSGTSNVSFEQRLRLFAAAGVPYDRMAAYLSDGERLSSAHELLLAQIYQGRGN